MTKTNLDTSTSILTITAAPGIKLTTQQKTFKKLVSQIDATEQQLQTLAALMTQYQPIFEAKLAPIRAECDTLNIEMIYFLDAEVGKKGWSANQSETMREIICHIAASYFDSENGIKMEAMFDKHSDISAENLRAADLAKKKQHLSQILGVDAADQHGQARTTEQLLEDAFKTFEDEAEREHAAMLAREAAESTKKRKQTNKSSSQFKFEQQALDTKSLVKDIYRKLTSAIHPDREPDEAERLRKTALMSEVNQAYESGNLLKLLQLQQALCKLDQNVISQLADEKLTLINRQLAMQLIDLQMERNILDGNVRDSFELEPFGIISEKMLNKVLKAEAGYFRDLLLTMRQDLSVIRHGGAPFKRWLKQQRELMDEDIDDEFDLELFDQAMDEMFPTARMKK